MRRPLWDIVVVSELLTLGFGCFYSTKWTYLTAVSVSHHTGLTVTGFRERHALSLQYFRH